MLVRFLGVVALLAVGAGACTSSGDCTPGELCLGWDPRTGEGVAKCVRVIAEMPEDSLQYMGALPAECLNGTWPTVPNCVHWSVDDDFRICESNDVPPYHVPPYCPFGIGQGYCGAPSGSGDCPSPCNSTKCPPFNGDVCPCVPTNASAFPTRRLEEGPSFGGTSCPKHTPAGGDVLVPTLQIFKFPANPNPLLDSMPIHMYANTALTNGNSYQVTRGAGSCIPRPRHRRVATEQFAI
jgi:hypothetical protein